MLEKLSTHLRAAHGTSSMEIILRKQHGGKRPTCECGCGQETTYQGSNGRFARFIRGHSTKIRSASIRKKQGESLRLHYSLNPSARKATGEHLLRWRQEHPTEFSALISASQRGQKKTKETRERIREGNLRFWSGPDGDDARAESSRIRKELWKKPEYGQKILATKRARMDEYRKSGGYGSTEWAGKISAKITELIEAGDYWARGRYTSPKAGDVPYRSSWELLRMAELDADPDVKSWEYEPFHIEYDWGGKRRRYIPDFRVTMSDGAVIMEEIGPRSVKLSSRNVAKRSALGAICKRNGWRMRWPVS